jgi:hypothetical protein
MAVIQIKTFGGISPKVPPRYLADNQAQVALDCAVFSGALFPFPDVGPTATTLTKVGTPQTIYRFGQSAPSDTDYWFHWTTDVDVARSQIAGDTSEWTFYTDGVQPKATYAAIALSGSGYPSVSRPLGLPAPTTALATAVADTAATATILSSDIAVLESGFKVGVSLDGATWTDVTVTTLTASAIAAQLTALTDIDAAVSGGNIVVTRTGADELVAFKVRSQTGTKLDTEGTFTYNSSLDKSDTGEADTHAYVIIEDAEIGSVSSGDVITVSTRGVDSVTYDGYGNPVTTQTSIVQKTYTATGPFANAAACASALTSAGVAATAYGSCVVLTPGSAGGSATDFIEYKRMTGSTTSKVQKVNGSEDPMQAFVILTTADMALLADNYVAFTVNAEAEKKLEVPADSNINTLIQLQSFGMAVTYFGSSSRIAVVKTELAGTFASLRIRAGDYATVNAFTERESGVGTDTAETRVYTYTNVSKEAGFEFESAPCVATPLSVDVNVNQRVTLTGFSPVPSGYVTTHRRIYRSTTGTFLFVAEIAASDATYTDSKSAEELGEEIPSLTWDMPPATLRGLINMPGGVMAGFTGRDVYFCDPYHPHAWPAQYQQSLDYPVVGLGRMDTTLAVLTTGTPYLIQGGHPDSMTVVKSDLEQSCASKRSIVSTNGAVLYASPDGLVMLSSNGSKIVTEQYFTRAQWQSFFKPDSIHAYQHDLKYIGFYDNGTTQGSFVYDLTSGSLITTSIYATAGYNDLQVDKLFVVGEDRAIKPWFEGAGRSYVWRSKKFTFPKPVSMACAQLEAESYPATVKFYVDNTLAYTHTVTDRSPFRLAAVSGRDWEAQIEGSAEVFGFAMAQSMMELSDV